MSEPALQYLQLFQGSQSIWKFEKYSGRIEKISAKTSGLSTSAHFLLFKVLEMKSYLQPRPFNPSHDADLTAPLRKALDRKYGQVVDAARKHWERNFAGKEPSDSCVSVRISRNAIASSRPSFRRALAYGL